jgi:hypothetical protein
VITDNRPSLDARSWRHPTTAAMEDEKSEDRRV